MTTNDDTLTLALDAFCKRLVEGHPSLPTGEKWDAIDLDTQNKIKTNILDPLHTAAQVLVKPRTLTTEAELDALPVGSVVLAEDDGTAIGRLAFQRWDDGLWYRTGARHDTSPDYFLPATVLHVGGDRG